MAELKNRRGNLYELRIPINAETGEAAELTNKTLGTGKTPQELRALDATLLLAVGGWGPGETPEHWPQGPADPDAEELRW